MKKILNKKICTKVMVMVMATVIAMGSKTTLFAKNNNYDYYTYRGVKYISYLKNTFDWSANSKKIVNVDKKQSISGIMVVKGGIKKVKSKSSKKTHVYDCVTKMLAGAEIGGITIGYTMEITDRITIKNTGAASVEWDI